MEPGDSDSESEGGGIRPTPMGIPPDAAQALLLSTAATLQELGESQKRLQAQMEAAAKGPATPASAASAPPP
eukprot:15191737-Alexandrium_andersonii.AAC.1